MGCVYIATNRVEQKSYIGQTIRSLGIRRKDHYRLAEGNCNTYFSRVLALYDEEDFQWGILYESNDRNVLCEKEREYIDLYETYVPYGYNMSFGGEGVRFLPEQKEKLSEFWKNKYKTDQAFVEKRNNAIKEYWDRQNTIDGIFEYRSEKAKKLASDPVWIQHCKEAWTEEARKQCGERMKIRMAQIKQNDPDFYKRRSACQKPLTEEQKLQRSEMMKSRFADPEYLNKHIERTRQAAKKDTWIAKNKIQWEAHKKPVVCIETGEYFDCARDAAVKFGTTRKNVCAVVHGKQHTTAGHVFRFATAEEINIHKGETDVSKQT